MKAAIQSFVARFDVRERFVRSLGSPGRVLELGCGRGTNALTIRRLHPQAKVHGVDIFREPGLASFVDFTCVDLDHESLPYPDNHFEAILFTHVIEHLSRPLVVAAEIGRVLAPGGRLYIETPNWTATLVPSFGVVKGGPFNFYDDPTHVRPWTKHALHAFLSQHCGLEVERVATVRNLPRLPVDVLAVIRRPRERKRLVGLFWNLYGWCIYGIGRKPHIR